LTYACWYMYCV